MLLFETVILFIVEFDLTVVIRCLLFCKIFLYDRKNFVVMLWVCHCGL